MQESSTRRIYDLHSFFYDATFGRLVRRRVQRAIEHMNARPGESVLDLGIGTGISLNFHASDIDLVGVDLSAGMLREARKKVVRDGLDGVRLLRCNALELPFEDNAFDHVFLSHVISVVSDPVQLLDEARRVARPGSSIVMVNHFQSTNRFIGMLEKWLCPLCTKLGWRSDLALSELVEGSNVEIDYRFKLQQLDLWETVVIRNTKPELAHVAA